MNLIFLGPPGSGKGTQAIRVAEKLGVVHLSTGDVLREAVKAGSELGKKADTFMKRGELVPDDLIIGLIEDEVASGELGGGFILDGFPRTIPQAVSLKEMFVKNSISVDKAILLSVSDDVIVGRIKGRAEAEGRADDTEEVVRNRLAVYNEQTAPLVDFYRKESVLMEIPGEDTMDGVFNSILEALK
jgi:adenylate kinase